MQAKALVAKAKMLDVNDRITETIRTLTHAAGGKQYGLKAKFKSPKSLARKIYDRALAKTGKPADTTAKEVGAEREAAAEMGDVIRFTSVLPNKDYARGVDRIVAGLERSGFKVTEVENKWVEGKPYKGVHIGVVSPNGQVIELQVHTQRSWAIKERRLHKPYEVIRTTPHPNTPQWRHLSKEQRVTAARTITKNLIESHKAGEDIMMENVPGVDRIMSRAA